MRARSPGPPASADSSRARCVRSRRRAPRACSRGARPAPESSRPGSCPPCRPSTRASCTRTPRRPSLRGSASRRRGSQGERFPRTRPGLLGRADTEGGRACSGRSPAIRDSQTRRGRPRSRPSHPRCRRPQSPQSDGSWRGRGLACTDPWRARPTCRQCRVDGASVPSSAENGRAALRFTANPTHVETEIREHRANWGTFEWPDFEAMFEERLAAEDFSDATVLDLGTGEGRLALALAPLAKLVVGLDVDEQALAVARERARELGVSNATFVPADADTANYRLLVRSPIDYVVANHFMSE